MYINEPATYTDYYELTMAQGYYLGGKASRPAVFDYFFRKNPFKGGYVVFAGINNLVETLEQFSFSEDELSYLHKQNFDQQFLEELKDFRFTGTIWSAEEGEIVFPGTPVVRVEGNLLETQLIETLLLNILNFQSLVATKAARMRLAAGKEATLLDFGLRRSQGLGGIHATRAALIGGFDGTSNVHAAQRFGVSAGGTMAHSWIQSFDSELDAFRAYARYYPESTILLVDTYDTLATGVPNAITVAKELEENGNRLHAIRLDSGDLAYMAKKSRKLLDDAGLHYVKIAASNQLDERVIQSLKTQKAPIDIFGVGTRLVTGDPDGALDGVYKLASVNGSPRLKVSENIEKITLPGIKELRRYYNEDGTWHGDAIGLANGDPFKKIHHPTFPVQETDLTSLEGKSLHRKIIENGRRTTELKSIRESSDYRRSQLGKLQQEYKRFDNPHIYKVGITPALLALRDKLLQEHKS